MTLVECCKLAQDITRVSITILQTAVERAEFCSQHQFHPIQEYLLPHNIEFFLEGLSSNEIVSVTDLFQLKLLFFRVNSVPVAIGPFCTEFFSLNDCESLLRQLNLKNFSPSDLLAHRGQLSVSSETHQRHIIHCLFHSMEMPVPEKIREINYNTKNINTAFQDVESNISYAELVEQRYGLEASLMKSVEQGDVVKALESWTKLHNSVTFFKSFASRADSGRSQNLRQCHPNRHSYRCNTRRDSACCQRSSFRYQFYHHTKLSYH